MPRASRPLPIVAVVAALVGLALLATAGPLDPPEGPVTSTYKTLDEVEPRVPISDKTTPGDAESMFRIEKPGSYYLTAGIAGADRKNGIMICADGVSIDLMGFEVSGVTGSLSGIVTESAGLTGLSVRNGVVRGWDRTGVDLSGAEYCRVSDVRALFNGEAGIATGTDAVVTGCVAGTNRERGIQTGSGTTVTDSVASDNGGDGMGGGTAVVFRGCASYGNLEDGFGLGIGSSISGCTAQANTVAGISISRECQATENTCIWNGVGIRDTYGQNRVEGNHCAQNTIGFQFTNDHNFIIRNTAVINGTNWDVVAGNVCLVVPMQQSGPINGDAGGVSPGSTDPWANFSYSL